MKIKHNCELPILPASRQDPAAGGTFIVNCELCIVLNFKKGVVIFAQMYYNKFRYICSLTAGSEYNEMK